MTLWIHGCPCCWARPAFTALNMAHEIQCANTCYQCEARYMSDEDYVTIINLVNKYSKDNNNNERAEDCSNTDKESGGI
jgi:hypothetical protein